MQNGISTEWRYNLLDSKSAGEEPDDHKPSRSSAVLSHTRRKSNILLGCVNGTELTRQRGNLCREPHVQL